MFDANLVDGILNISVLVIWTVVIFLGIHQWREYWKPVYFYAATPTVYHLGWKKGWHKGSVRVIRSVDCFEPKLTKGFHSWNYVVPLDIGYDELAEFIRTAQPDSMYAKEGIEALEFFQERLCAPYEVQSGDDDEALDELLNHGLVMKHYDGTYATA